MHLHVPVMSGFRGARRRTAVGLVGLLCPVLLASLDTGVTAEGRKKVGVHPGGPRR